MVNQPHEIDAHERQAIEKRIQVIEAELLALDVECSTNRNLAQRWERLLAEVSGLKEQIGRE